MNIGLEALSLEATQSSLKEESILEDASAECHSV